MRHERTLMLAGMALLVGACHRPPPPETGRAVGRTVFNDSLLHAEQCAPAKAGEDWRRVCTPKDQGAVYRRPQPTQPNPRIPQ
jgi:hypothetical protein